jgi:hypothetical protein
MQPIFLIYFTLIEHTYNIKLYFIFTIRRAPLLIITVVWIGIVSMPDPDPNFHVDADSDPDPDPDWHQNDADPHADPNPRALN